MAALTFFRATDGSNIGAKRAAKDFALFVKTLAFLDDAITIIVCAIQFCHWL